MFGYVLKVIFVWWCHDATLCCAMLCFVMLWCAMLCYVVLWYVVTRFDALRYYMSCYDMLRFGRHVLRAFGVWYDALCYVNAMLCYVMLHIPYERTYDRRDWGCWPTTASTCVYVANFEITGPLQRNNMFINANHCRFLWPIDPPSFNPGAKQWQLQAAGCNSVSIYVIYRLAEASWGGPYGKTEIIMFQMKSYHEFANLNLMKMKMKRNEQLWPGRKKESVTMEIATHRKQFPITCSDWAFSSKEL